MNNEYKRKPSWLTVKVRSGEKTNKVRDVLKTMSLHTVCEEANCPNRMECFSKQTATFLILGNVCTRSCRFCNITNAVALPPDPDEPERVAGAIKELGLRHAVITSVTRDDLEDGGASYFAELIGMSKKLSPGTSIEVLIPDFQGDEAALDLVVKAGPDVINHNIETIKRLYPEVRPQAVYERSLELISRVRAKDPEIRTKSGIMLGLGEREEEVLRVFSDLLEAGCDFLTVGQYLAPSKYHYEVKEYITPEKFECYGKKALQMGFQAVASAPFVRSSYNAGDMLRP